MLSKNKKASVVTDEIDHFTNRGIKLKSGDEIEADLVVTATGLNMELLSNLYFVLEHSQIAKTIIGTRCISSNSAVVIIGRLPDRISESSKLTQNP